MTEQNQTPNLKSFTELKDEAKELYKAAKEAQKKLKEKIASGETVDATSVLVNEVLPLLALLNQNQANTLESLEDADSEGYDDEYDDEDGDNQDADDDSEDGGEGDDEYDDELPEGVVEISEEALNKAIFFLRLHAFDIPNGSPVDEKLKSPETLRLIFADILNDVDPDAWPATYATLLQNYPNVPFQKELEAHAKLIQEQLAAAQAGQQTGQGGGGGSNTGGKA